MFTEDSPEKPLNQPCKVVHVNKSVADIEAETTIIYLSAEDGHISKEMEQLNKNFSFLKEFKLARKQLGIPIKCDIPKKYYILYGCIIRKTHEDHFDFVSFRKCVSQINKNNKKDGYVFVAIQAIKDDKDDLINEKNNYNFKKLFVQSRCLCVLGW
ncbi:hypothetical protein NQ314_004975 [Rhamnusium bicolor]|uniref:Uncharacterized protein n=1 Tax=Rhamnusium bicolor TaxID=1586634 RepID=A0AAV8ZJ86_9CUCU|nr:hypothetical protein NQ314_004975 [Rhamnusium bicolor]